MLQADESIYSNVLCSFLIALPVEQAPTLLAYDHCAQSMEVTLESPFISIGSGSFQADPFLAFLKRIFWSESAPEKTSDGVFCTLWTLDHVSRVNGGLGVGGRPHVFVVGKQDHTWQAVKLSEHYLEEQLVAIGVAEEYVGNLRNYFGHDSANVDSNS